MLRNYNYMLTIILFPFIVILSYLKLINVIQSDIYTYLILIMSLIFIPSFIMSLYASSEEILKSDKKWRIIFLVTLSIFYLPIYYTKYVYKEEKYLGYLLFVMSIALTILAYNTGCKELNKYLVSMYRRMYAIEEKYVYRATNNLFSIKVDSSFRCNDKDVGDYVISCDRLDDDSFIGVYSYDVTSESEEDIKDKLEFHTNQTIDYITEKGYEYISNNYNNIIILEYNSNTVLITQRNYELKNNKYSLVIMKEMPTTYINLEEYQKMIDSISFLNYNG